MKKTVCSLLVALSLIFLSCSKDIEMSNFNNDSNQISDKVHIAIEKYANAKYGKTKGNVISVVPICSDNDTLAYILNYGEGWELLSGVESYIPILAKGQGSYNKDSLNKGQRIWLEMELEKIKAVKYGKLELNKQDEEANRRFWKRIQGPELETKADGDPIEGWELIEILDMGATETSSGHLIKTQWGQNYPWNQCVPYAPGTNSRCVAGCVAVAGAQLLKFLHDTIGKPALFYTSGSCEGSGNNVEYLFANPSPSAWENMALVPYDNSGRLFQSSLLIGWVGKQIETSYSLNGSSAYTDDLKDLMSDLSISCSYGNYSSSIIWNQLANGMPIYVRAENANEDGHAWIIDGSTRVVNEYRYIYKFVDKNSPYNDYGDIKYESVLEANSYILMNWGWNNLVDDNLYINSPTANWTQGGHTFYDNKKIMYNFN